MCVFMCIFFFFLPNYSVILYGSATFRNENAYALQVSVSPNLRKDIYTRKGLNTLPPTQRLTSDIMLYNSSENHN